jgi:toxin ParE1/3/4
MRFRFSRRAMADIEEIGDFIAVENPARAATFIAELRLHCRRLAEFPQAAPLRPDIGEGVRLVPHGRYVILYVVHADLLEIRRVVHGARDLDTVAS